MRFAFALVVSAALLPAASPLHAQTTRYVTDSLKLEARRGPTTEHRITRYLDSGTAVTVIEVDAESGHSHVRLEDGEEVWILSRYLMDEPTARTQLDQALERLSVARQENKRLATELDRLEGTTNETQRAAEDLTRDKQQLQSELAQIKQAAADTLAIRERNTGLGQQVKVLKTELEATQLENRLLREANERDMLIAGAGLLFGGVILGVVLPRLKFRRRRWGEL